MSKVTRILAFAALTLLLSTCSIERVLNGTTVASIPPLPSDQAAYVPRSFDGAFEFKTLLPVNVNLTVRQYRFDAAIKGPGSWTLLEPLAADVYVVVADSRGTEVYTGKMQPDGHLATRLLLPAAAEDLTFTLSSEGFLGRSFTVKAASGYESIDRTVSMEADEPQARGIAASAEALPDRDGDGVPDVYDAFPDDPEAAFAINVPFDGPLTIAFEDLYGQARAGDADYNDFIATYRITEIANGQENAIVQVDGTATSVAKIAGFNHGFSIAIDSFTGWADLTITYPSRTFTARVASPAVIPLFPSTASTVGQTVSFSLHFDDPQPRESMDEPPYNPFLHVWNTGYDIHLIGEQALPGSRSHGRTFQDAEGFPWALLVPAAWQHPAECQRIEVHYPRFTLWRQSFGAEHTDWYLHYDEPYVAKPVVHVAGYYNTGAPGARDVAAYWKDDAAGVVPLYDLNTAHATSVAVSGSDVYVAGLYKNANGKWAAGYWENGQLVPLYSHATNTAGANAIAVSGQNVYVAGWVNEGTSPTTQYATVWKDGSPTTLWGTSESEGLGVAVSGVDVYVSGYYTSVTKRACWWMNDTSTRTDLYTAASSKGLGVAVSGSDVYVAGYYSEPSAKACYWQTTQAGRTDLGVDGQATSVFVAGSNVYVAGYYKNAAGNDAAGYWKNGDLVPLDSDTTGTSDAYAYSIFVVDGVVYAAGQVIEGTSEVACYWEDGVRVELYRGATAKASSIVVTKE